MLLEGRGEFFYLADHVTLEIVYDHEDDLVYDMSQQEEPLGVYLMNPLSNNVADRPYILGRLKLNDITCIYIYDERKKFMKSVRVVWEGERDYWNDNMQLVIENGLIKINIDKF